VITRLRRHRAVVAIVAEGFLSRLSFGLISFGVPMGLSVLIMPPLGFGMPAALLMGAIIGSHTLLAYPIVSRLGLVKNRAVTTVVGGTLVTDTLALAVLAVVAGSLEGEITAVFLLRLFGILGLYVTLVLIAVPRVGRWFFRNAPGPAPADARPQGAGGRSVKRSLSSNARPRTTGIPIVSKYRGVTSWIAAFHWSAADVGGRPS
jgi:Kef-type K+ transport system membrane component KefB